MFYWLTQLMGAMQYQKKTCLCIISYWFIWDDMSINSGFVLHRAFQTPQNRWKHSAYGLALSCVFDGVWNTSFLTYCRHQTHSCSHLFIPKKSTSRCPTKLAFFIFKMSINGAVSSRITLKKFDQARLVTVSVDKPSHRCTCSWHSWSV